MRKKLPCLQEEIHPAYKKKLTPLQKSQAISPYQQSCYWPRKSEAKGRPDENKQQCGVSREQNRPRAPSTVKYETKSAPKGNHFDRRPFLKRPDDPRCFSGWSSHPKLFLRRRPLALGPWPLAVGYGLSGRDLLF